MTKRQIRKQIKDCVIHHIQIQPSIIGGLDQIPLYTAESKKQFIDELVRAATCILTSETYGPD